MDNNPSILSHVSIGTNRFGQAVAFYDAVLAPLGCKRLMEYPRVSPPKQLAVDRESRQGRAHQ